ncbi:MAG: DUF5700 domain-containing putative Zn-dependent protease [Bacilli bacterium]|nr:hypothetical protein [Bacilli bacterium]MDD3422224.1 hypothetical protein [Bacilli bacterium]MDD4065712.1 hypothetical protein [Bacilli bacterium]
MKVTFDTKAIQPMADWLMKRKRGVSNEAELRTILKLPEYGVEFKRYNSPGLPMAHISYEEAVDFFLNFDKKTFTNPRLEYKREYFIKFYEDLENKMKLVEMFNSITSQDQEQILTLLKNGLPSEIAKQDNETIVLLIVSIGNSLGWPYENYIDFDVANLALIKDKDTFIHIIAHELHHTHFEEIMPSKYTPSDLFLINFAFEGLAVHFNNNAYTEHKPSKYKGPMIGMCEADWQLYGSEFAELFNQFKQDYLATKTLDMKGVQKLLGEHYEQFTYKSLKDGSIKNIQQYPTYYLGCYFYGSIDLAFGKEKLYETLKRPDQLISVYNEAAKKLGNSKYLF